VVVSFDWHDARLYSIDVDRFSDGDPANDFGSPAPIPQASAYQGGDWLGLRQKIEEGYFTNLGVNALLLTIPMKTRTSASSGAMDTGTPRTWDTGPPTSRPRRSISAPSPI
jgi:alpha-amylase